MAKQVVRYLLEGDGSVPLFITDGGYYKVGDELVGVTVDESVRHVPSTVVRLIESDLATRIETYILDADGNAIDSTTAASMAAEFFDKIA